MGSTTCKIASPHWRSRLAKFRASRSLGKRFASSSGPQVISGKLRVSHIMAPREDLPMMNSDITRPEQREGGRTAGPAEDKRCGRFCASRASHQLTRFLECGGEC